MRAVSLLLVLILFTSSYALRVEDGLRIELKQAIEQSRTADLHSIAMEFITVYLDTLKHKELLELTQERVREDRDILTQTKIKAKIDKSKKGEFEKVYKRYTQSNNEKLAEQINYIKAKKRLQTLLQVEVNDVKLPLIQKPPESLEKCIKLALNPDEPEQVSIKKTTQRWRDFNHAKKQFRDSSMTKKQKIENAYELRVATLYLHATNPTFIDSLLLRESSLVDENSIIRLYYETKIREKLLKKQIKIKQIKKPKREFCFKVDASILNVRATNSTQSKIVHRYQKDDTICSINQTHAWVQTKHGWCSKEYLLEIKPKP